MANNSDDLLLDDETIYNPNNSKWRASQGVYLGDVDARLRLLKHSKMLFAISQGISIFLVLIIFVGVMKLIFFTNYETLIMDDGSQLFCTIDDDGSIAVAY